MKVEEEI